MGDDHTLVKSWLSDQNICGEGSANSSACQSEYGSAQENMYQKVIGQNPVLDARRIIDEMPGGFFIYRADDEEEILYANRALFRIFNCDTLEEFQKLTGNSFKGMVHSDDLEEVEASIKEQIAVSKYDLDYVEYRIIQKGGQIRWIEDYGHFIHSDLLGDVFYVFVGDATEKHRRQMEREAALQSEKEKIEQKLRKKLNAYGRKLEIINQEQLRRLELIEGLSIDYESILYVDIDAGILQPYQISKRIHDSFKNRCYVYEFSEFSWFGSHYIEKWVYEEDKEYFARVTDLKYIVDKLSKQKVYHVNYRIIQNGKIRYLQLCIVNVGSIKGSAQTVIGCRNIDDEIRHEMEHNKILEEALNHAKASNRVKDIFLANMSHDIRTPMNAIVGFTALAKVHMKNAEKLTGYLGKIEESGRHLLQLLDDVLELSRLESNKIHIEDTECDLYEVAGEVQKVIQPQAEEKGLMLLLELDAMPHHVVYGDKQYLVQLLLRIAGNAVKYTESGGSITISIVEQKTSHDFASYQFIVEDTGIGISESFLEHIFEPFERQKNTTMSGVYGTGLGLTIVKNIVEMMGGTIEVSSAAGRGSRFIVTLSLRLYDKAKVPDEQPVSREVPKQTSGKILLVEDNEINLEIETELLTDFGFQVETAVNGSIAVEKLRNSKAGEYSLVLMDIQMPVMDGYSAARAIRGLEEPSLANIPIIALSANTFEEDQKKSMESGMNAHLGKPIHIQQFFDTIKEIIGCSKI